MVAAAGSVDPEVRRQAFDALVAAYWKLVYKYVRVKWGAGAEDARDLTQELFTRALEKRFFDRYDPTPGALPQLPAHLCGRPRRHAAAGGAAAEAGRRDKRPHDRGLMER